MTPLGNTKKTSFTYLVLSCLQGFQSALQIDINIHLENFINTATPLFLQRKVRATWQFTTILPRNWERKSAILPSWSWMLYLAAQNKQGILFGI